MSAMFSTLARFINMSRELGRKIFTRRLFCHVMQIKDEKREQANYSLAIHALMESGVIRRHGARAFVIV